MPRDLKRIIESLKIERAILIGGGYECSEDSAWTDKRLLRDSIICLNLGTKKTVHPCNECLLWELVPEEHRQEEIPCHYVPLNEQGECIASLEGTQNRKRAEEALLGWLDKTIRDLESKERTKTKSSKNATPS